MKQRLLEQGWRLLPGSLTALGIALCMKLGMFQPLEQLAYQALFQARGPRAWDDRLVLVTIDDASVKQLGRFPWPRQYYTRLINRLTEAQAGIVVVNLIWSEASAEDARLAEAMAHQGQVVLPQAWDASGMPLQPVPVLEEAAIATGHVLKQQDSDGIVRQVDLQIGTQPALGVAALQAASLMQDPIPLPPLNQSVLINWVAPAKQLHQVSFVDVLQGRVSSDVFRNRIVLLGVTATGLDSLVTPFDRNPATGSIILHATLIQNLLQQNSLHSMESQWFWLILLLGGPGISWGMATWNTRQQLIVIVGLCSSWGMLCLLLFQSNYLMPVASPIILVGATALASALTERLRENYLLRQQVAQLWKHYRSDLVISPQERINPLIPSQAQELTQPQEAVLRVAQLAALAEQFGRSQSTQAVIARTLSIGLLAADLDERVWFCNPVAIRWLQVELGSQLRTCLVPDWLSREQWLTSLEQIRAGESVKHVHVQQGDRWFDLILNPLFYTSITEQRAKVPQPPDGFLLLLEDVTEYKQAEKELKAAKEAAEAANRSKSEFLANISHELRTPLNVILGFTQVMSHDQSLKPEHQKHLAIINRSGQHLLNLINDVLEMSKIEAGRTRLNPSNFNLHHLLDDLEEMMRLKATAKQLALSFERSPDLPRYIALDEGKLRQVLLNLLGNAIKFTQQGQVSLRVWVGDRVLERGSQNSFPPYPITLNFEVEDTGCGIASDEIHKLFRPFVQAKAGQQAAEGTGLGLAISRTFINLMGGDITLESMIGQGSIFRFSIQAVCLAQQDTTRGIEKQRIVGIVAGAPTYRILIVEDQQENSQFLVKLLAPIGFAVKEACNGEQAITLWQTWRPHLILMDIRMPVLDGYEATRRIRAAEQQQRLPSTTIIALSASVFEETETAVITAGCNDFLRKPVQADLLLRKLGEHLKIRYIYESQMSRTLDQGDDQTGNISIDQVYFHCSQMPLEWIRKLDQAANLGADRQLTQLIREIPETHAPLAQALLIWTNDYQFDEILHLTHRYIQPIPASTPTQLPHS